MLNPSQGRKDDSYSLRQISKFNLSTAAISAKSEFNAPCIMAVVLIVFSANLSGTGETLKIQKVNRRTNVVHTYGKITIPALSPDANYIFEESEGILSSDDDLLVSMTRTGGAVETGTVEIVARRV